MSLMKSMLPPGSEWAAFGAGRHSFTMLAQAYILGGHCRIGMEDTVHLAKGTPTPSNAALVEKSVRIIREPRRQDRHRRRGAADPGAGMRGARLDLGHPLNFGTALSRAGNDGGKGHSPRTADRPRPRSCAEKGCHQRT